VTLRGHFSYGDGRPNLSEGAPSNKSDGPVKFGGAPSNTTRAYRRRARRASGISQSALGATLRPARRAAVSTV
jgi:hypothetical protein